MGREFTDASFDAARLRAARLCILLRLLVILFTGFGQILYIFLTETRLQNVSSERKLKRNDNCGS
jgi:hypothetical protein